MQYKGIDLVKVTEPQVFNPPKKMMVWDSQDDRPTLEIVYAITTEATFPVVINREEIGVYDAKMFCAEIPEEPKSRRVTNYEFSRWLAQGNGQCKGSNENADTAWNYMFDDVVLPDFAKARKWDDTEWHEPTAEYLGLEEK